jgi:hypothetical protein
MGWRISDRPFESPCIVWDGAWSEDDGSRWEARYESDVTCMCDICYGTGGLWDHYATHENLSHEELCPETLRGSFLDAVQLAGIEILQP